MTEKLYCFALYIWLYWFILHILGGGDVKQNFRDSCPKWLCYLDLVLSTQSGPCFVIFFGISRVYHLWSITLVFQKRSREKDWALDLEMKLVICNKNRRKSLPLTWQLCAVEYLLLRIQQRSVSFLMAENLASVLVCLNLSRLLCRQLLCSQPSKEVNWVLYRALNCFNFPFIKFTKYCLAQSIKIMYRIKIRYCLCSKIEL